MKYLEIQPVQADDSMWITVQLQAGFLVVTRSVCSNLGRPWPPGDQAPRGSHGWPMGKAEAQGPRVHGRSTQALTLCVSLRKCGVHEDNRLSVTGREESFTEPKLKTIVQVRASRSLGGSAPEQFYNSLEQRTSNKSGMCPFIPTRLLCPRDSPGKDAAAGCRALPQGIFPTRRSNSHLLLLLHWQVGSLLLVPPGKPCVPSSFQTAQHILHSELLCPRHLGGSLIVKEGPGREVFNLCL